VFLRGWTVAIFLVEVLIGILNQIVPEKVLALLLCEWGAKNTEPR
jgi:hypothetical protein